MEVLMVFALLAIMLLGTQSDAYKEFSKHSNGMDEYVFVQSRPCETGLRDSGYALSFTGRISLKQVNEDGTVSDQICTNKD